MGQITGQATQVSGIVMNVQQAIAQFLEHGQTVRNLSDRTLRAYQSDLAQFHVHMADTSAVDVTPEHLEAYLDKLGVGPYRDTSIRRKVAALKVFFRYLEDAGVVSESPARLATRPPGERAPRENFFSLFWKVPASCGGRRRGVSRFKSRSRTAFRPC